MVGAWLGMPALFLWIVIPEGPEGADQVALLLLVDPRADPDPAGVLHREPEPRRGCWSSSAATAARCAREGFYWTNPFTIKRKVSLRAHNLNSQKIKVNDLLGNPIEIGAVVVWQVQDTAQADLRRRELRAVRRGAERVRHPPPGAAPPLRRRPGPYRRPDSLRGNADAVAARAARRAPEPPRARRHRGHRGAPLAPRLRARDRLGHAPAPAGGGDHRGAQDDRRRRRRAWSSTRSTTWARKHVVELDDERRPRSSATCWSCSAATAPPRRSSTRARLYT